MQAVVDEGCGEDVIEEQRTPSRAYAFGGIVQPPLLF
jgi:hypothetical protein